MDITFECPECGQQLEVDGGAVGMQIECPGCAKSITIPSAPNGEPVLQAPLAHASAEAKMERHFVVPQHAKKSDEMIEKPKPPLEVAAKEKSGKLKVKSIKRGDCQEVGKDRFDETVTDFINKVGESNIVHLHPLSYSHVDLESRMVVNYGLMIIYRDS